MQQNKVTIFYNFISLIYIIVFFPSSADWLISLSFFKSINKFKQKNKKRWALQRQIELCEFKARMMYIERPYLKNKQKPNKCLKRWVSSQEHWPLCRGPRFDSRHQCGSSERSVPPAPGDLAPSSVFLYSACMWYTEIHQEKTKRTKPKHFQVIYVCFQIIISIIANYYQQFLNIT